MTELLRDFPKIRRAAMRGERVVVKTRSGNLVLIRENYAEASLYGSLASMVSKDELIDSERVFTKADWSRPN